MHVDRNSEHDLSLTCHASEMIGQILHSEVSIAGIPSTAVAILEGVIFKTAGYIVIRS